jgi:hypothetical protein
MLEVLPEGVQRQVVDRLHEFIEELHDEARWDGQFQASQEQLMVRARQARWQIAAGQASALPFRQ